MEIENEDQQRDKSKSGMRRGSGNDSIVVSDDGAVERDWDWDEDSETRSRYVVWSRSPMSDRLGLPGARRKLIRPGRA